MVNTDFEMDRGWEVSTCKRPSDWVVCAGVEADPLVSRILWALLLVSLVLLFGQFYLTLRAGRFGVTLWSKTLVPGALVILGMSITKLIDPTLLIIGRDVAASVLVVIALFSYTFSTQNLSASFVSASLDIAHAPAKAGIEASLKPMRALIVLMSICLLVASAALFMLLYPMLRFIALRLFHLAMLGVSVPCLFMLAWQGRQLSKAIANSYPNTMPPAHLAEFTSRLDAQAKIAWIVIVVVVGLQIMFAVCLDFSSYFFLPCLWMLFTSMQLALLRFFKFKSYKPSHSTSRPQSQQRTLIPTSHNLPQRSYNHREYSETKANVFLERSGANPLASAPVSQTVCAVVITQALQSQETSARTQFPRVDIELVESPSASIDTTEEEVNLVPLRILTPSRDRTQRTQPSSSVLEGARRFTPSSMVTPAFTFEEGKSESPATKRRTLSEDNT